MLICLACLYVAVFLSLFFLSLSLFLFLIDDYSLSSSHVETTTPNATLHLVFYVRIRVCGWTLFIRMHCIIQVRCDSFSAESSEI
jgi:hypothetical protein